MTQQIHTGILLSGSVYSTSYRYKTVVRLKKEHDWWLKSIVQEAKDIHLAMELITLGARLRCLAKRNLAEGV